MSVSVAYVTVILAGNSVLNLLTEPGVFKGVYMSGMRATPWNELVVPVLLRSKDLKVRLAQIDVEWRRVFYPSIIEGDTDG